MTVATIVDIITMTSMYAVIGAGFVIIYKTSRILNLAAGESFMLGAYFVLVTSNLTGSRLITIVLALTLSIVLGVLIYLVVMRPVFGQPIFVGILLTAGLSILFRAAATLIWGPHLRVLDETLHVTISAHRLPGGIVASTSDIATLAIAVFVLGGLFLFLRLTPMGIKMRATAENPLLSAYRGINVTLLMTIAWGIAALVMAMMGIVYGTSVRLEPEIGFAGLKALAVPLVGGLDSLLGVIPGAIVVAVTEYIMVRWYSPVLGEVAPYFILMIVLMIRPWGLFGTHEEIERV